MIAACSPRQFSGVGFSRGLEIIILVVATRLGREEVDCGSDEDEEGFVVKDTWGPSEREVAMDVAMLVACMLVVAMRVVIAAFTLGEEALGKGERIALGKGERIALGEGERIELGEGGREGEGIALEEGEGIALGEGESIALEEGALEGIVLGEGEGIALGEGESIALGEGGCIALGGIALEDIALSHCRPVNCGGQAHEHCVPFVCGVPPF